MKSACMSQGDTTFVLDFESKAKENVIMSVWISLCGWSLSCLGGIFLLLDELYLLFIGGSVFRG